MITCGPEWFEWRSCCSAGYRSECLRFRTDTVTVRITGVVPHSIGSWKGVLTAQPTAYLLRYDNFGPCTATVTFSFEGYVQSPVDCSNTHVSTSRIPIQFGTTINESFAAVRWLPIRLLPDEWNLATLCPHTSVFVNKQASCQNWAMVVRPQSW